MKALLKNNKYEVYIDYIELEEPELKEQPSPEVIKFLNTINKFWKRYNCTYDNEFIYIKDHPLHYTTASTYKYQYQYSDKIKRYLIFGQEGAPCVITEKEFDDNFDKILIEINIPEVENGLYITKIPFELDSQDPTDYNPNYYDSNYSDSEQDDDYNTISNFTQS